MAGRGFAVKPHKAVITDLLQAKGIEDDVCEIAGSPTAYM